MRIHSYELKWIAVITMLIDHIGAVLFPLSMGFRYIGRLSFPIFCFLIVEGFCHTHDFKRYIMRMGIFALLSEIPYDLAFGGKPLDWRRQNVFITLVLGLLLLKAVQMSHNMLEKLIFLLIAMWLAVVLKSDYSYKGILLIFWFYVVRDKKIIKLAGGALWNLIWNTSVQGYGMLAMLPIAAYDGKRGRSMKYFFYLFYPLHLLVLYAVSVMLV